jgi:tripartite motif-containing protein 71
MGRRVATMTVLALALLPVARASADFGFLRAWGAVGSGDGQFGLPDGIGVDNAGIVWVADGANNRVERFTANGRFVPFEALRHQHRSAAPGRLNLPYDVAPDALGNVYVADTHNHRIQEFSRTGKLIRRWGSLGSGPRQFNQPRGIAVDPFGNVWVADHQNRRVEKYSYDGRLLGVFGRNGGDGTYGGGVGEFHSPRGLSADAAGNIYVADDVNNRIVKLAQDGSVLAMWGRSDLAPGTGDGEFHLPYGTAVDRFGFLWVADTLNNRLVKMTTDGVVLDRIGAGGGSGVKGNRRGQFNHVYNVATDCAGNVYATDQGNWRVQKFGDPAFGRPVCPPRLRVARLRVRRGVASARVTCDRPCKAWAAVGGKRGRVHVLRFGGSARVAVRVPVGRRAVVRFVGANPATRVIMRHVKQRQ